MNYNEMSDFEINKLVSYHYGYDFSLGSKVFVFDAEESTSSSGMPRLVDYCNSWNDMGPVIEEYGIQLNYNEHDKWFASSYFNQWLNEPVTLNANPLRAAAICYLMMKESTE